MFLAAQAEQVVRSDLTLTDWIVAGLILAGGFAVGRIGRGLVVRTIGKHEEDEPAVVQVVSRFISTLAVVAAFIYALSVLGIRLGPLVGALGIGGLAIAFAAQSILANFLASVILQVRRPFRNGDLVQTNDLEGTVEDINFRTVVLRTYSGERAMVPCAEVLSRPIVNYATLGRRRTTLELGITYDTDFTQLRKTLLAAVAGVEGVREQPPPEVWVEGFGESTVNVVVRFWHAPDLATLWRVRNDVAIALKTALDDAGVDMPFPQRVLHFATAPERAPSDVY